MNYEDRNGGKRARIFPRQYSVDYDAISMEQFVP